MGAIFKRELKAYFYSPIAYVIIGLFIFISSIFYSSLLKQQYAEFAGILGQMGLVMVFLVPILTMRIIAEDRKNGTEILLVTSPQSVPKIVLGKFFALLSIFGVMVAVTFIYPAILFVYGNPALPQLISAYIGFILLGATFISIGLFASALTENQIISAVISFVILLAMWIMDMVSSVTTGVLSKILDWLSILSRYSDFNGGILNLSNIIYYLSIIIVFVFITIQLIERRRWSQG